MNPLEYLGSTADQWPLWLEILCISTIIHAWPIKVLSKNIFDPIFLILIGDIFAATVVVFMYLNNDIATRHLVYFLVSQLALYTGYLTGKALFRFRGRQVNKLSGKRLPESVFYVSALVNIGATLAIWMLAGIPIFRVSRLGAFVGSGGFGILERLASASSGFSVFACLYLIFVSGERSTRRWAHLYGGWLIASSLLSGSKSGFVGLLYWVFAFLWIYYKDSAIRHSFWGGRVGALLGTGSVLAAILVLATQGQDGIFEAASALGIRMLSFGDVYIYAYPNNLIDHLQGDNPFVGLFGGFLSTFRLFDVADIYKAMGLQLTDLVFPDLDYLAGPNPRHNIMVYHYFGLLGPLVSFAIGMAVMKLQTIAYYPKSLRFRTTLLGVSVYMSLASLSVDFEFALSGLANTIIMYTLAALLSAVPLSFYRPIGRAHA